MFKCIKNLRKDSSGGALIFVGLSILTLFASMATAIEMGRVFLARSKAQAAVDAAVLAASAIATKSVTAQELQSRADKFFQANYPLNYLDTTINSFSLSNDNGIISGSVQLTQDTYFASFVGLDEVNMTVRSQVKRELHENRMEISLVLDHTASMCLNDNGVFNAITCPKFKELGDAVNTLVTELQDAIDAASDLQTTNLYYSYIPFNHDRRLNNTFLYDSTYANYLPNVWGLRSNGQQIVNQLRATRIQDLGGTNTAVGTVVGWQSLRPQNRNLFVQASAADVAPMPITDRETYKIMIMLTDGENEFIVVRTTGRDEDGNSCADQGCVTTYHDYQADSDQEALCPLIKEEGIEIFAIVFDVPSPSRIETIFRGCASEPKALHYYRAEEGNLERVFERIANTLINLRITQ